MLWRHARLQRPLQAKQDDQEELPWQVIAILDMGILRQLSENGSCSDPQNQVPPPELPPLPRVLQSAARATTSSALTSPWPAAGTPCGRPR